MGARSNGGGDRRRDYRAGEEEGGGVSGPIERISRSDQLEDQEGPEHRFKGASSRDNQRSRHMPRSRSTQGEKCREVGAKGTCGNSRPDPESEEKYGGKSDAGRGPFRRCVEGLDGE